ncbi:uncharacterized protein LOC135107091 isoform X1 [Scylla paramamosain]|uniref:uncharacterized protein LOC135107091 isoform X1 n=1 Tax=Scylla paramamosain TaxID=85552 RepID=UPI003082D9CB
MSDQNEAHGTPRRSSSSSSEKKRREKDSVPLPASKRRATQDTGVKDGPSQPRPECGSPPAVAGPSRANTTTECSSGGETINRLSALLSDLIEKLDNNPVREDEPYDNCENIRGLHDISSSEEDATVNSVGLLDPLDELDTFHSMPASQDCDEVDFLKALGEFSGLFHSEEQKGEPLSERLASILNLSLRRRPSAEGIKSTCEKIKLPGNVPNLKVPVTNAAVSKTMSFGGKLIDAKLTQTNGLISKALIPIALCISDIGEKKGKNINSYLDGLNMSLRLLSSVINYINQLRKEVARLHVHDSALAELCKWEYEVGQDALFPFDVTKKCKEIHKTKKLGRPTYRPYKSSWRKYASNKQTRRPYQVSSHSRLHNQPRPFLGQKHPQGRGMHLPKLHQ